MKLVPLFSRHRHRRLSSLAVLRCARVVESVGRRFRCFGNVGVTFVDEEQIAQFGHGRTDVLAFPYDSFGPDLGDVFINLDYLSRLRPVRRRQRRQEELVAHAMLHLCGFTHDDRSDYLRMRKCEAEVLGRPCLPAWRDRII